MPSWFLACCYLLCVAVEQTVARQLYLSWVIIRETGDVCLLERHTDPSTLVGYWVPVLNLLSIPQAHCM